MILVSGGRGFRTRGTGRSVHLQELLYVDDVLSADAIADDPKREYTSQLGRAVWSSNRGAIILLF